MSDHSIKLTYEGGTLSTDEVLQRVFNITQIPPIRCVKVHNGFKVFVANADQLSPFLSSEGRRKLAGAGFEPQLPPEMRARCTVVAKKVDRTVTEKPINSIRADVTARNSVNVLEVYVPPESRIVKIRVQSPEEANKLLKDGIRIFNTSVPAYNIEPESYIQIDQCFKCCRLGHLRNVCTNPQCCTRCGEEGHFFQGCTKPAKCKNCGGAHTAVSGTCPEKKKILQKKRKDLRNPTMSQSSASSSHPTNPYPLPPPLHSPRSYQAAVASGISQPTHKQPTITQADLTNTINISNQQSHLLSILHTALILANHNTKLFAKYTKLMLQINGYKNIEIPEECLGIDTLTIPPSYAQPQPITHPNHDPPPQLSPDSPHPTPPASRLAKRMLEDPEPSTPKRSLPEFLSPKPLKTSRHRRTTRPPVQSTATDLESDSYSCAGSDMEQEADSEKEVGCESDLSEVVSRTDTPVRPILLNPGVTAIQREAGAPDSWSVSSVHTSDDGESASQCSLPDITQAQPIQGSVKGKKSKAGRAGTGGTIPKYRGPGPGEVTPRKKGGGKLKLAPRPKE